MELKSLNTIAICVDIIIFWGFSFPVRTTKTFKIRSKILCSVDIINILIRTIQRSERMEAIKFELWITGSLLRNLYLSFFKLYNVSTFHYSMCSLAMNDRKSIHSRKESLDTFNIEFISSEDNKSCRRRLLINCLRFTRH